MSLIGTNTFSINPLYCFVEEVIPVFRFSTLSCNFSIDFFEKQKKASNNYFFAHFLKFSYSLQTENKIV